MWKHSLWKFLLNEGYEIIEWAKCGDGYLSTVPTLLWTFGASAFAHRLITCMFRRFVFRRVTLWERIVQNLLFIWMVMYSLQFWNVLVSLVKDLVEYYDDGATILNDENLTRQISMQQWLIWLCGAAPMAIYIYTKPRPSSPPIMIWITTSPWQRREMGPYGYYLNRPFSTIQSFVNLSLRERALTLRRTFSDSKIIIKEPPKKRRHSKSI
ncbi:unnamed protein product [Parnassius mnemosyne]|uniref:Uncharacterized protein n=1 Tax=Parnassius mnemosyne TaxID=213953 RepID=A0AAV1KDK5_9NEOP